MSAISALHQEQRERVLAGGGRPISRRTVAAGVAWAVPAIVVATASPAAAASMTTMQLTGATGLLDPSADSITFDVSLDSSGPGEVQFLLLDGVAPTGLPTTRAVSSGANTVSFTAFGPDLHAGPSTLTYSVDGGATTQATVVNVASPTTYTSGSAVATGLLGLSVDFTLRFAGSAASTVVVSDVRSGLGAWTGYPAGPQPLTASDGGGYQLTFTAQRLLAASPATVTFSIDGGPAQQVDIVVAAS